MILYWNSERALGPFAEACFCVTPRVFVGAPGEVFLDLAATAKHWGGEDKVLEKALRLAEAFELDRDPRLRVVLSDRAEWARPLATGVSGQLLLKKGQSEARLLALPLAALVDCALPLPISETRAEEERRGRATLVAFLLKLGLKTLGDFARLPPETLGHRFGKEAVIWQAVVRGERPCVLAPFVPKEVLEERIEADEIHSLERLLEALGRTFTRLEARLRGRALAAKALRLEFALENDPPLTRSLVLIEPLQESQALVRLLRDFLRDTKWTSPLLSLVVKIPDVVSHAPGQLSLFDDGEQRAHEMAAYVARLRAQVGDQGAGFAVFRESHLPEQRWSLGWPPAPPPARRAWPPERPLFVYFPTRPCRIEAGWRLTLSEKLTGEWWNGVAPRQYAVARAPDGSRFWVYWDEKRQEWFLQGVFE